MHLGTARTALYCYLLARQTGGQFLMRLEDTDTKRTVEGAEQELYDGLRWLGLQYDEGPDIGGPCGPYRQTERRQIYRGHIQTLIEGGHAYPCFCTPERLDQVRQEQMKRKESTHYDGTCRAIDPAEADRRVAAGEPHVIRFKMPREGSTTAVDLVRGPITVENRQLDDYIIVRSDGLALYHLAAMVDDYLMKITHVIRGSEWLPTFPLHALIVRAFGWPEPAWVHLSIFLKPSGKGKMSKREKADLIKDGYSFFIKDLKDLGYVPEAVVNWIALMGWSYDDRTEFFSLPDLIEKFSLEKLNPAPAAINYTKLDYFNGLHIRALPQDELARRVKPFLEQAGLNVDDDKLLQIMPLLQERLGGTEEAPAMIGFFFQDAVEYDPKDLIAAGLTAGQSLESLRRSYAVLSALPKIDPQTAEAPMRALVDELGFTAGQVFGILRVAVTGQKVSPPLFESMAIIGREMVLQRIQKAIFMLEHLQS
jgi:glutamyl-tRNA synthetase